MLLGFDRFVQTELGDLGAMMAGMIEATVTMKDSAEGLVPVICLVFSV